VQRKSTLRQTAITALASDPHWQLVVTVRFIRLSILETDQI
jgi:hypothetical protein